MGKNLKGKELGKGISQRTDGLYQARYTDCYGKRKTLYNSSIMELRKELEEQRELSRQKKLVKKDYTLNEWFEIWKNTYKVNVRNTTKNQYNCNYRYIKDDFGNLYLKDISKIMLQQKINELKSDNIRKKVQLLMNNMYKYAIEDNLAVDNIAKNIVTKIDNLQKSERRILTREETVLLLDSIKNEQYKNMVILALNTGMRFGEIAGLKWEDIDFEEKSVNISRTLVIIIEKNNSHFEFNPPKSKSGRRKIPLTQQAILILKKQKLLTQKKQIHNKNFSNLVFTTKNGTPYFAGNINIYIKNYAKKINISNISFHCFRHTFATRAIENGMNPKTLQKILGHSTLAMTMDLYCHVTDNTIKAEMAKMENIM